MSRASKLLIIGGAALLFFGMTYGLWYAAFAEHQRLDQVGGAMASAFSSAASGNQQATQDSLAAYGRARAEYIREVDAHSHWTGLALLLMLIGAAFGRIGWSERTQWWLAIALVVGAVGFPASVLLENVGSGILPKALAAGFASILILATAVTAMAFMARAAQPDIDSKC